MKTEKESKNFFKSFKIIIRLLHHTILKSNTYPSADLRIKFETVKKKKKRQNIISNLPEEFRQQSDKRNMFLCTFLVKKNVTKKCLDKKSDLKYLKPEEILKVLPTFNSIKEY